LRLLALPEPVQTMLHQNQLEMGHARALLALPVVQQLELAHQAVERAGRYVKWSARTTIV
jgi:ParB family chromosome partitioning protein